MALPSTGNLSGRLDIRNRCNIHPVGANYGVNWMMITGKSQSNAALEVRYD